MPDNFSDRDRCLPATASNTRDIIPLGNQAQLDLSTLPEQDRNELKKAFAKGQIDLANKMQELGIDNHALSQRLGDMSQQVAMASRVDASATITGAYNDKMGRTEVIIGNTETAAKGKLDRSQKGESDQTLFYVVIAAIVIVIVAGLVMGK